MPSEIEQTVGTFSKEDYKNMLANLGACREKIEGRLTKIWEKAQKLPEGETATQRRIILRLLDLLGALPTRCNDITLFPVYPTGQERRATALLRSLCRH